MDECLLIDFVILLQTTPLCRAMDDGEWRYHIGRLLRTLSSSYLLLDRSILRGIECEERRREESRGAGRSDVI